jgi:hypothetical protein
MRSLTNLSLPNLRANLSSKNRDLRTQLEKLPRSLAENPQAELLNLCARFIKGINQYARGLAEYPETAGSSFLQESKQHYRALKEAILRTKPRFQVEMQRDETLKVPSEDDGMSFSLPSRTESKKSPLRRSDR